jgi:hypothetical protein
MSRLWIVFVTASEERQCRMNRSFWAQGTTCVHTHVHHSHPLKTSRLPRPTLVYYLVTYWARCASTTKRLRLLLGQDLDLPCLGRGEQ